MALLRGKLFAGALLAGALLGPVADAPAAPVVQPVSSSGVNGATRHVQVDEDMRKAMLRSRIEQEDEELMLLVSIFVRTL